MRAQYDFSDGVRGKYAGKVDTADVHRLDSAKDDEQSDRASPERTGEDVNGLTRDGEARHRHSEPLPVMPRKKNQPKPA